MNVYQKIGIILIILTWITAGLSAFYDVPYFSDMSWKIGLVVSIILSYLILLIVVLVVSMS